MTTNHQTEKTNARSPHTTLSASQYGDYADIFGRLSN